MLSLREMQAMEDLFNDAVRGKWDRVVTRYREHGLVAQGIRVSQQTGDTVLHLAVSNGDADIVEKLVAAVDPADTDEILGLENHRGDTPLHLAAALGMKRMCRVIARRHPKLILEARNDKGETPLFVAARHGRIRTFLELHRLSRPMASSSQRDLPNYFKRKYVPSYLKWKDDLPYYCMREDGNTILHCAIAGEHFELAFHIMNLYEDLINVQNFNQQTALHLLAGKPHAFKSGSHLQLFDHFIYELIVVRPRAIEEYYADDADDAYQRRFGADNTMYSGDRTSALFSIMRYFWAKIAGTGSDKKSKQGDIDGRSSEAPTQPLGSSNQLQPSNPITSDRNHSLEEIHTEDGYGAREEEPENSLKEIVTEGDPDEGTRARMSKAGTKKTGSDSSAEEEEHQTPRNKYVRRPPGSYDQILKNVAGWPIFLIIYALKTLLVLLGVVGIGIWRTHIIRGRKQKHKYAFQIMEELVERSTLWTYKDMDIEHLPPSPSETYEGTPILIAAKNGVQEVVKKIVDTFPVAMQDVDGKGKNVVLLAAENRHPDVYKLMLKSSTVRDTVFNITDFSGNSALHLAATLGANHRPWNVPGAALQMQWEIKWYKFIERSMGDDPSLNYEGQNTKTIFSDHHEGLIKEGSKWLTKTSQSCSVVAALIAAVAFASISTVPGGTDQNHATPLLQHEVAFKM